MAAIDGDLLERVIQFCGALEIGDELVCSVATAVSELGEQGTAHRTIWSVKFAQRCTSVEATVRPMPTGLLISCATPATSPPSAASLSVDEIALRFAGMQSCFGQPPLVPNFGKQRGKNQCADRHKQNADLGRQDALGH